MNYNSGYGSGMYNSSSYGGLGGSSYGGGLYGSNSMYGGGYGGGLYGGSGMYGGGMYNSGFGGQMGGYGMGMGGPDPYGNQDPNNPFGAPPSPPGFWMSFLRVVSQHYLFSLISYDFDDLFVLYLHLLCVECISCFRTSLDVLSFGVHVFLHLV